MLDYIAKVSNIISSTDYVAEITNVKGKDARLAWEPDVQARQLFP